MNLRIYEKVVIIDWKIYLGNLMTKILEIPIEEKIDIISFSIHSHFLREIWLFLDTSIFVRLTDYFIDKKPLKLDFIESFKNFVSLLSTQNLNIQHFSLFEASKKNGIIGVEMNDELAVKHIQSMIIAQCVDLQKSSFETSDSWVISQKRMEHILSQYKFESNNIEDLANKIYASYKAGLNKNFFDTIANYKNKAVVPFLEAIRHANMIDGNISEKLNTFFAQIENRKLPYCPRIVDYCIRLVLLSGKDPLLKGALKKIKTEIDNTAIDFALFELAKISNFSEPFPDIKPIVSFFTCDRNMYYYARLGHPLQINLPNLKESVYFPDLSYLKDNRELIEILLKYFKINPPEELKEFVLEKIKEFISIAGWTESNKVTFQNISRIDFKELEIYKYYYQYGFQLNE